MLDLVSDARLAVRSLAGAPASTLVAVVTLAVGIGATTTLFGVFDAVWLAPLPFREPDRLVAITLNDVNDFSIGMSWANFSDVRTRARSFEELSCFNVADLNLTGTGRPEAINGIEVLGNFFELLGMEAHLGRHLVSGDDLPDADPVAVLSYDFWMERFGGDPDVIGSTLLLEGSSYRSIERQAFTVVGVLPEDAWFRFRSADVWIPFRLGEAERADRMAQSVWLVGRLEGEASPAEARAELDAIFTRLERDHPELSEGHRLDVEGIHRWIYGDNRTTVALLLVAASLLLCIACGNVAHLVSARISARRGELAVRTAVGAGGWRIARLLGSELLVLAFAGGLTGLGFALLGVDVAAQLMPSELARQLPGGADAIEVNARVFLFSLGASVLTAFVSGLLPLLRASKLDVAAGLTHGARGERGRQPYALLVSEIALCFLLLVGAGVTLRSFVALAGTDLGFEPRGVLSFWAGPSRAKYPGPAERRAFYRDVRDRLDSLPRIGSYGFADLLPHHVWWSRHSFETETLPGLGGERPTADVRAVDDGYFRTMRIPLRRGRLFDGRDSEHSQPVAIISHALAERYWPGTDPIGKLLYLDEGDETAPLVVVGIAGDVRVPLVAEDHPVIYRPWSQAPPPFVYLVVRSENGAEAIAEAIRRAIWSIDPDQPVKGGASWAFEDWVSDWFARTRFTASLLGAFSAAAFILAAAGVFAVVTHHVRTRYRELGIRKAVGATPQHVLLHVLGGVLGRALGGVLLGLAAAFVFTGYLQDLLYGVTPMDPVTVTASALILAGTAVLAGYLPARRASSIDPARVLRGD